VNNTTDDAMTTIKRFNEERAKSKDEIWMAIQNLTKAIENLVTQKRNQAKCATHETVGAPQPRHQRTRRPLHELIVCYRCN